MSKSLNFSSILLLVFLMFGLLTSCTDSEDSEIISTEEFVGASIDSLESQGKIGRGGCYEFIFPITINFDDGSDAEVADYTSLRETISAWKENNPDAQNRPTLSFPLEVMSEDGSVTSIESQEELREIRRDCRRSFFNNRRRGQRFIRTACFDIVYPITIEFPDGSTTDADSKEALKSAIREWRQNAERPIEERPTIVFPITVEFEDGTQVDADSREALRELKDQCANDN